MTSRENADYLMQFAMDNGIRDPAELSNFMGQLQVESGGFGSMHESLHYSGARLLEVFPGRNGLHTLEQANAIVAGGQPAVAEAIYGGDWGNSPNHLGNTETGDGWKYRGRCYVQLTGRTNYQRVGDEIGVDLVGHPELAAERAVAAKIAVHFWASRVVPHGHQNDVQRACEDINGGDQGLSDRRAAAASWAAKLAHGYMPGGPEPVRTLRAGSHGAAVSALQTHLGELGYLATGPDGKFGAVTKAAVEAFQREHGLPSIGAAGPATQLALQTDVRALGQHSPTTFPQVRPNGNVGDDPRSVLSANHGLYAALQRRIPDASEERLLQFTAACRSSGITAGNLGRIHLDESARSLIFAASWPPGALAQVDLKQPAPLAEQSIQRLQVLDHPVQHQEPRPATQMQRPPGL